jgi:hypothetical protein
VEQVNALHPPEVVPSPRGGWTVVRAGFDERGPFECWVGEHFPTREEAHVAARAWEEREPSTAEDAR